MHKIRLLGLLLVALIVVALFPSGHASAAPLKVSASQASYTFNVTIQGNIDQAISFSLPAQLLMVPTINPGGSHPFDLCLSVGSQLAPFGNPVTGAITLDSNSACMPGFQTQVDMGSVTYDQSTAIATLQIDPNASSLDVNAFNTSGGIAGGLEIVISGTMQLQFTHNSTANFVNGNIQVIGNESAFSPTQGDTYTATISGSTN